MERFNVDDNTDAKTLVNCLYNSLHSNYRYPHFVMVDSTKCHYSEVGNDTYVRTPWANEIEPIVDAYIVRGFMPCADLERRNLIPVVIKAFLSTDEENNVIVADEESPDEEFAIPAENLVLGWIHANWYGQTAGPVRSLSQLEKWGISNAKL